MSAYRIAGRGVQLAAALVLFGGSALAQGEAGDEGQLLFNNACRTCHTVKAGDNRLGPSLSGVVGRKSGAVEGVAYSSALADGAVTWDAATLDKFLADPQSVAPGTTMKPFGGIASPEERAAIIGYLEKAGGS